MRFGIFEAFGRRGAAYIRLGGACEGASLGKAVEKPTKSTDWLFGYEPGYFSRLPYPTKTSGQHVLQTQHFIIATLSRR